MNLPTSDNPKFLLEAEKATQIFWEERVRSKLDTEQDRSIFRAILGDPVLRSILEFRENGATDLEGALMLKALGFLEQDSFQIGDGPLRGQRMQFAELNKRSEICLDRWKSRLEFRSKDFADPLVLFLNCIRSYLAIDRGSGIVLSRRVAEVALDVFDRGVLGRSVFLDYDILQFDLEFKANESCEEAWIYHEKRWSRSSQIKRTGASVTDLWEAW